MAMMAGTAYWPNNLPIGSVPNIKGEFFVDINIRLIKNRYKDTALFGNDQLIMDNGGLKIDN